MDLQVIETFNGGDLLKKGNDLAMVFGFQNMVYLALFGGNKGYATPQSRNAGEQNFDYWANSLLFTPKTQFNSLTESALDKVALNSAGRILIQEAVNKDLEFMREFAEVTVTVSIVSDDVLNINIKVLQPDNLQSEEFVFIWDATNKALSQIVNGVPVFSAKVTQPVPVLNLPRQAILQSPLVIHI